MTGRLKAAVYVFLTFSLSFIVLTISSRDIDATTWEGTYSTTYTSSAPYANSDSAVGYGVASPHANFALVDNSASAPAFQLSQDGAVPDGQRVGFLFALSTLGLLNADCISPIFVNIPFMDGTTDVTHTADWEGSGTNLVFDDDNDGISGEGEDSNGIPTYADHYPTFLNAMFDPDGPGSRQPVRPRARYVGHQQILSGAPATQLNFVIFNPGVLGDVSKGLPAPRDALGSGYGYVNVVVLNNPQAPAAPSTITGFCTGLSTVASVTGLTTGVYTVVDGPEPIEVDRVANNCTNTVAGPVLTIIPDDGTGDGGATDDDGDGVDNDGCLFIPDPCVGIDYTGNLSVSDGPAGDTDTGTLPTGNPDQGEDPAPATDDGGLAGADEGCADVRSENPGPLTGIYGTGTHLVRSYSQAIRDADNDGVDNGDDNCPIHPNANQADTGDNVGIGDACDPGTAGCDDVTCLAIAPDSTNNDSDQWPPQYDPTASEDGAGANTCSNGFDDPTGDTLIDEFDPDCQGSGAETPAQCTGADIDMTAGTNFNTDTPHLDDDGDGVINDGCGDTVDALARARVDEDPVNNFDDDGDTLLDEDGECRDTSGAPDYDGDCYLNEQDNCILVANDQSDFDELNSAGDSGPTGDGIGDKCEPDWDGDTNITLADKECKTMTDCSATPADQVLTPPVAETAGAQCADAFDNAPKDTRANDGCVQGGNRAEVGAECINKTNDDVNTYTGATDDALINDGCPPAGGGKADGHYHANAPLSYVCVPDPDGSDDTDNDTDSDDDDDKVCDSTEVLLGSDKDDDQKLPEYYGLVYSPLQDAAGTAPSVCDNLSPLPAGTAVDDDGDTTANNNVADECPTGAVGGDTDKDGVPDTADNCDSGDNPEQADSDGDTIGDECETPDPDSDSPAQSDLQESYTGADPLDNCPDSKTDIAWGSDADNDADADPGDILKLFGQGQMNKDLGDAGYAARSDADADGDNDPGDLLKFFGQGQINTRCEQQIDITNNTGMAVNYLEAEFTSRVVSYKGRPAIVDDNGTPGNSADDIEWTETVDGTRKNLVTATRDSGTCPDTCIISFKRIGFVDPGGGANCVRPCVLRGVTLKSGGSAGTVENKSSGKLRDIRNDTGSAKGALEITYSAPVARQTVKNLDDAVSISNPGHTTSNYASTTVCTTIAVDNGEVVRIRTAKTESATATITSWLFKASC